MSKAVQWRLANQIFRGSIVAIIVITVAAQQIRANSITGTHDWEIVARLTGPAGSDSINPTWNVGIGGTDLGFSVNHKGKAYYLFGDTFASDAVAGSGGPDWRKNVMAYSTDFDPSDGITFDGWLTRPNGTARQVITPGTAPVTYIPTGGISVGDNLYVWYMHIENWDGWTLSHAGLGRWREGESQFTVAPGYQFSNPNGGAYSTEHGSQGPGNFGMVAASYRNPLENSGDPHIYLWGTPGGREGGVKLARVLPEQIENLAAYEYFAGDSTGTPQWGSGESSGVKLIESGVGEMSVIYNEALREWTMMSISGGAAPNIEIRHAENPWGPWSAPKVVTSFSQAPGLYSPYMNPLLVENGGRTVYFTVSLWDPYDVYLAKVTLDIDFETRWEASFSSAAFDSNWSHGLPTAEHRTLVDNSGTVRVSSTSTMRELVVGSGVSLGGAVQVSPTGSLTVGGAGVVLSRTNSSNGALSVSGGALEIVAYADGPGHLIVGERGAAAFTLTNGAARIAGNLTSAVSASRATIGQSGGVLEVNELLLGGEGDSTYSLAGNGVVSARGVMVLGRQAGSTSSFTQTGGEVSLSTANVGVGRIGLQIGERGSANYTISGGTLDVPGAVWIAGQGGSQGEMVIDGGAVHVGGDMVVGRQGDGVLTQSAGELQVDGRLRVATGRLELTGGDLTAGSYLQEANATLAIGVGAAEQAALAILGTTTLGGSLVIELLDDYLPSAGATRTLLNAGVDLLGAFANVASGDRIETLNGEGSFLVHYGVNSPYGNDLIVLDNFQIAGLRGDYNSDGLVDAADYTLWRDAFGAPVTSPYDGADGDGSGRVDQADYSIWAANYGALSADSPSSVPEPSTLVLCVLLCFAGISERR